MPNPDERELLGPRTVRKISTPELAKTIITCENFPRDQDPYFGCRHESAMHRIVFAPLPAPGQSEASQEIKYVDPDRRPDSEYLDLRFSFRNKVKEDEINALARMLLMHIKDQHSQLHHVSWEGLKPGNGRSDSLWSRALVHAKSGQSRRSFGASTKKRSAPYSPTSPYDERDDRSETSTLLDTDGEAARSPRRTPPSPAQNEELAKSSFFIFAVLLWLWSSFRVLAREREFGLPLGVVHLHVKVRGRKTDAAA